MIQGIILLPYYLSLLPLPVTDKNCFPNMSKNFSLPKQGTVMQIALNYSTAFTVTSYLNHYYSLKEKSGGYRSRTDDPLRARQML